MCSISTTFLLNGTQLNHRPHKLIIPTTGNCTILATENSRRLKFKTVDHHMLLDIIIDNNPSCISISRFLWTHPLIRRAQNDSLHSITECHLQTIKEHFLPLVLLSTQIGFAYEQLSDKLRLRKGADRTGAAFETIICHIESGTTPRPLTQRY